MHDSPGHLASRLQLLQGCPKTVELSILRSDAVLHLTEASPELIMYRLHLTDSGQPRQIPHDVTGCLPHHLIHGHASVHACLLSGMLLGPCRAPGMLVQALALSHSPVVVLTFGALGAGRSVPGPVSRPAPRMQQLITMASQ